MKYQSEPFNASADTPKEDLGDGIVRQILGFDDSLMLARVWFEENAIGQIHTHPHSQLTYIESGEFEATVGDQVSTVRAGDSVYISPNTPHGVTCKKKGALLDVFSPIREDFFTPEKY